ncbi:hypothetical protein phytr_5500 [Candidatus Phycorickettsia trachydisci]|uniref:Uncharacterized protein n=1 Tax=Candidatus Phycorickettsia trachydisci TaxID=2115978 RepID=A0A2P1P8C1_9RICK|nr:hypothetical protein [Candidatus Phycorickettsia trachydisci]AVP87495.1 hypothetical protein phytr_5500 [Candidatus Phycorickettsia trachydisci]
MKNTECYVPGLHPAIYAFGTTVLLPFIGGLLGNKSLNKSKIFNTIQGAALCAIGVEGVKQCLTNPSIILTFENIGLLSMNIVYSTMGVLKIRDCGEPVVAQPHFAEAAAIPQLLEARAIPEAAEVRHD